MSTTHTSSSVLGRCPDCGAEIDRHDVVIEYEDAEGDLAVWATCPACRGVVHPA